MQELAEIDIDDNCNDDYVANDLVSKSIKKTGRPVSYNLFSQDLLGDYLIKIKAYLTKGSPAANAIKLVLEKTIHRNRLCASSASKGTSLLECHHSNKIRYTPKNTSFDVRG